MTQEIREQAMTLSADLIALVDAYGVAIMPVLWNTPPKEYCERVAVQADNATKARFSLLSALEALAKDAARYRWLRDQAEDYDGHACFPDVAYRIPIPDATPFHPIDAAIDAAMSETALAQSAP